jgi:hypothetical protein
MLDGHTDRHLDRWLEIQVPDDDAREAVKSHMLTFAADDLEYWIEKGWPELYDASFAWKAERAVYDLKDAA